MLQIDAQDFTTPPHARTHTPYSPLLRAIASCTLLPQPPPACTHHCPLHTLATTLRYEGNHTLPFGRTQYKIFTLAVTILATCSWHCSVWASKLTASRPRPRPNRKDAAASARRWYFLVHPLHVHCADFLDQVRLRDRLQPGGAALSTPIVHAHRTTPPLLLHTPHAHHTPHKHTPHQQQQQQRHAILLPAATGITTTTTTTTTTAAAAIATAATATATTAVTTTSTSATIATTAASSRRRDRSSARTNPISSPPLSHPLSLSRPASRPWPRQCTWLFLLRLPLRWLSLPLCARGQLHRG